MPCIQVMRSHTHTHTHICVYKYICKLHKHTHTHTMCKYTCYTSLHAYTYKHIHTYIHLTQISTHAHRYNTHTDSTNTCNPKYTTKKQIKYTPGSTGGTATVKFPSCCPRAASSIFPQLSLYFSRRGAFSRSKYASLPFFWPAV